MRSTYEIFRNSAHAFGDKTALTFLRSGDPADAPIRWSYAELLAGIHQTANLLHALGVGPGRRGGRAAAGLPRIPPGAVGRRSGGHRRSRSTRCSPTRSSSSLMTLARAKVLIAYGSDDESGIWSKAMRMRGQVPTLTTVLRVAPHDEPRARRRRCPKAWPTSTRCARRSRTIAW